MEVAHDLVLALAGGVAVRDDDLDALARAAGRGLACRRGDRGATERLMSIPGRWLYRGIAL